MAHWLVKQEPEKYSFEDLEKDGNTLWDGVRNYQARNNLREMKLGDSVVFYHSSKAKEAVGTARVVREGYPDPTAKEGDWTCVDLEFQIKFKNPVSLRTVKATKTFENCALVRQSRLSVMPLTTQEYKKFLSLGG